MLLQGPAPGVAPGADAAVPGGLQALSFIARGKSKTSPERFFVDYARTLIHHTSAANPQVSQQYQSRVLQYFERLASLESYGTRAGDRLTITLRVNDQESQRRTARVANFLGWKAFASGKQLQLEVLEKTQQSRRKETASALEIDEIALQEALQAGKPFTFQIPYGRAAVRPDEKTWRHFYPAQKLTGGLAEAMARDRRLAKLYVALHDLSVETRAALLAAADLNRLAQFHADQLYYHSSSLGVFGGRVLVPGGEAAEPAWSRLAGADARTPPAFLRALLEKDHGLLLVFYSVLAGADLPHQRFATREAARAQFFYDLFRRAPEQQNAGSGMARESALADFLRGAPLDAQGRLRLAGGAAAWRPEGIKGPPNEEVIIERMARAEFSAFRTKRWELSAFMAAARIEQRRKRPLDEVSARLLARYFFRHASVYPYFEILSGLGAREFEQFFALGQQLHERHGVGLNHVVGQFHSLVVLICLAQQAGALSETQAAEPFHTLCTRFAQATSLGEIAGASLDVARTILAAAAPAANLDDAARTLLLGQPAPARITINGVERELDAPAIRHADYKLVLELQKVPSLESVAAVYGAARNLAAGSGNPAEQARHLEAAAANLPVVDPPPAVLRGRQRQNLDQQDVRPILAHVERIRRAAAQDPGEVAALARDLLDQICPQVKLALSGILYAYYLRPGDLLVSDDPLLLRKHQFVEFAVMRILPHVFLPSSLQTEPMGSYLAGGFADLALTAGHVALAGSKQSESPSEPVFAAQVGRLRATQWRLFRDEDLKLAAARIEAGRQRIEQAMTKPGAQAELAAATTGLLSPARRAQLFGALQAKDPPSTWRAATLPDLYWLGGQRSGDDPAWLGQDPAAPYEDHERCLLPQRLAERVAEFPLYLSEYFHRRGWPAAALPAVAEPLAQEILRELPMSDLRDWRSVIEAFATIDDTMIERVLAKP